MRERPVSFSIRHTGPGLSRVGTLHTPHGDVQTPAFVAVGTKATVKGMTPDQLRSLGLELLIANTYHLYLTPGEQVVAHAGGVGAFMGWHGPTMTDSGGFQVFSLGVGMDKKVTKFTHEEAPQEEGLEVWNEELATSHGKLAVVDDDGVTFTSHLDGSLHRFTPERSIEIQHALGADIIFAFDDFVAPTAPIEAQRESMERTHRWATRSLAAHRQRPSHNASQGIYGIVQGGRSTELRIESAKTLADMDFDGYGIGGSFSKHDILGILDRVNALLPTEKPRHLLGIAEPEDVFIGVAAGCDTFDCVLPTRNGRNGTLYTRAGKIAITRSEYKDDLAAIDAACTCFVCTQFTKSYLHHLFRAGEMLGPVLATAHNLAFFTQLMAEMREHLAAGTFASFREQFFATYNVLR